MTRTLFTSYYSQLFVIFIWHHVSQNCSHLGEIGALEHFVYHAKGVNLISVTGHDLRQGLSLVHIGKILRRKWFFPCFSIPTAPSSPLSSLSSSLWLLRCVYPFSRFSFTFFPKFYFLITWLVTYSVSYILLPIVSKDVHNIPYIAYKKRSPV